jgi:hypothetical protein
MLFLLRHAFLLVICGLALNATAAWAQTACQLAKVDQSGCVDPLIEEWDAWAVQIPNQKAQVRIAELEALQDGLAWLKREFPCGLSYTQVDTLMLPKASVWGWVKREEGTRLRYVGYSAKSDGQCAAPANDVSGTLIVSRERKVHCPRNYTWFVRDDHLAVCVKE